MRLGLGEASKQSHKTPFPKFSGRSTPATADNKQETKGYQKTLLAWPVKGWMSGLSHNRCSGHRQEMSKHRTLSLGSSGTLAQPCWDYDTPVGLVPDIQAPEHLPLLEHLCQD